ncbi:hypothetical protein M011DRAFT_393978 [Sporormia fimetaria CBS 119925]|uniref:D-serine dehydratase n=1 Tax=Sporormia fimetaria CBS 119925 TaxID=1340428 RepID=A0A6A6VPV3_9PLEO|nr:hypothetical protein M011DRAFT_393978 [Sporormia fimetaria CBS 119925]
MLSPTADVTHLRELYVGKPISSLPTPSAIVDRAKVRQNCAAMLNVCKELGVGFRAHVKSHKTLEIAKLQVGHDTSRPANFIVSTLAEAERLAPLATAYASKGRKCNILYGVPLPSSSFPRLLTLASALPPSTLSILIDNPYSITQFHAYLLSTPLPANLRIGVFIKIDTGYARAGIPPSSPLLPSLVDTITSFATHLPLLGLYSHYGHSYAGTTPTDATSGLLAELAGLETALSSLPAPSRSTLILSVGATPTATSAQLLTSSTNTTPSSAALHAMLTRLGHARVELHAGVYPLLDLQQLATHARPASTLSYASLALRVLTEITSTYPDRSPPEALTTAGCLAMGREPCRAYDGWGVVSNPKISGVYDISVSEGERKGWVMGRVSQEHGVLMFRGGKEGEGEGREEWQVGDKVLLWPNHACVAGAGFGWYCVVDSDEGGEEEDEERVVDVWVRGRGW